MKFISNEINNKIYYACYVTKEEYCDNEIQKVIEEYREKYKQNFTLFISGDKPNLEAYKLMIDYFLE